MRNIIFISDLHIGDGSGKDDFNQDELFENFFDDWKHLENPELVIVGDGFEILESSTVMNAGLANFWEILKNLNESSINNIMDKHPKVLKALQGFPGKIWYVIGNHDYYIYKNDKLKHRLFELFPNMEIVPYYYDEKTKILAVHGNQFDSINRFTEVDGEIVPPLGDFVARYMRLNFDEVIRRSFPENVVKDYDNVRPSLDAFLWFEKLTQMYENGIDLLNTWLDNFINMMKQDEAQNWMRKNYPNMSKLSILFLNRVGGIKLGELMVRTVMQFRKFKKVDYLKRAAMKLLKDPQRLVRYLDGYDDPNHFKQLNIDRLSGLVMGHNHKHTFEVFKIDGDLKFYLNCGAWKPVVERKSKNIFQKYFEIFYAIAKVESNDDFEITTSITNKLKKQEILDFD